MAFKFLHTLGVDLGGTKTEVVALTIEGEECFRKRVSTVKGSYSDTIKTISGLVREAYQAINEQCPIGIAIPGAVSAQTKCIKNANSYWLNGHDLQADLALELQQEISKEQIFLENDANCFALSEATDGAGACGELVWGIILGTGSGSGIVHHKKLLRGRNLLTGEWGHNPLPWLSQEELKSWHDVKCFCRKQYCSETFISGTGLEREYAKATGTFNENALVYPVSSKEIMDKVYAKDVTAQQAFLVYMNRLARALANYINFLDPDVIVLGGGMSNIDELYSLLPLEVNKYIFGGEYQGHIVKAKYGDSSGVRGAAWLPRMYCQE